MKLTVFDSESLPQNASGDRSGYPRLSIGKYHAFVMNPKAVTKLGLVSGDKISFGQDQDGNWFVWKDPKGYTVGKHSDGRCMMFSHKGMSIEIKTSFGCAETDILALYLSEDPTIHAKSMYFGLSIVKP